MLPWLVASLFLARQSHPSSVLYLLHAHQPVGSIVSPAQMVSCFLCTFSSPSPAHLTVCGCPLAPASLLQLVFEPPAECLHSSIICRTKRLGLPLALQDPTSGRVRSSHRVTPGEFTYAEKTTAHLECAPCGLHGTPHYRSFACQDWEEARFDLPWESNAYQHQSKREMEVEGGLVSHLLSRTEWHGTSHMRNMVSFRSSRPERETIHDKLDSHQSLTMVR